MADYLSGLSQLGDPAFQAKIQNAIAQQQTPNITNPNGANDITSGTGGVPTAPGNQPQGTQSVTNPSSYVNSILGVSSPNTPQTITQPAGTYNEHNNVVQEGSTLGQAGANAITQDYGQQAVKTEAQNYLGQVQNRGAPQAGFTQLGAAPTMTAATAQTAQAQLAQMQAAQGNAALMDQYAKAGQTDIQNTWSPYQQAQMSLINSLQNQAAGNGPSVAATQLQQGEQQQIANQLAVIASQRGAGGNAALGLRSAADQNAAATAQLQQQQAVAREQEQLNAQGLLGQEANTGVGQQMSEQEAQAQMYQDINKFNAGNQQQQFLTNNQDLNQMALANLSNEQQANLTNMQQSNQMSEYNATNRQQGSQFNASNAQAAALANMQLQGQYGLQQGQMNQQTNMQDLAAQLQTMGMNDQEINNMLATTLSGANAQTTQALNAQDLINSYFQQGENIQAGKQANAANITQGYVGMGLGAAGGVGTGMVQAAVPSDEDLKNELGSGNYMYQRFMQQWNANKSGVSPITPISSPSIPTYQLPSASAPVTARAGNASVSTPVAGPNYGQTALNTASGLGINAGGQAVGKALLSQPAGTLGNTVDPMIAKETAQDQMWASLQGHAAGDDYLLGLPSNPANVAAQGAANADFGANAIAPAATDIGTTQGAGDLAAPAAGGSANAVEGAAGIGAADLTGAGGAAAADAGIDTAAATGAAAGAEGAADAGAAAAATAGTAAAVDAGATAAGGEVGADVLAALGVLALASDEKLKKNVDKTPQSSEEKAFEFGKQLASLFDLSSTKAAYQSAKGAKSAGVDASIASLIGSKVGHMVGGKAGDHALMADAGSASHGAQANDEQIKQLLSTIQPHSYNYKDPTDGAGTYISPMAQELAKTDLGKDMVFKRPDGHLMVDYGRGLATMLAGQSFLFNKLKQLEAQKK